MGSYVASKVIKLMVQEDIKIKNAKVLILGITFKENCPDVRNTRAVDVIKNLEDFGTNVTIYDPWANPDEVAHEYNLTTSMTIPTEKFDAVVLTVAHQKFLSLDLKSFLAPKGILYDVKGILALDQVHGRL
jgi:UDP-N-acetyl-D-galactosamine dehydrogenase